MAQTQMREGPARWESSVEGMKAALGVTDCSGKTQCSKAVGTLGSQAGGPHARACLSLHLCNICNSWQGLLAAHTVSSIKII